MPGETPHAESNALLAVASGEYTTAQQVLDDMNITELERLARQAEYLAYLARRTATRKRPGTEPTLTSRLIPDLERAAHRTAADIRDGAAD